VSASQMLRKNI